MTVAWEEVIPILKIAYANSFDKEGPGWTPLKESTLRRRRTQGQGTKILQASGRLRRELTHNPNVKRGPHDLDVSVDLDYAEYAFRDREMVVSEHYKRMIRDAIARKLIEAYDSV